jgi:D-alanyl-lipoteichoic acid acyltransferase DltB (MBOAT superfamily)
LLIEANDSREKQHISLGTYLLYTLNFTTLVSGPIQRYDEFARDQFADQPIALGPRVIGLQLERIVRGSFKVNVLAMLFDMVRADALAQISQPLPLSLKLYAAFCLVIVYPLFLYANFSGYIDIVIALARLMRVRLPENFDRPFAASSYLDFWNRWHMTLSNWLKTYVYNPLLVALMRRIPSSALQPFLGVFCFFVTFFLIGVWHGRTSEFVIFGVLTGGGVSINKLWQMGLTRAMGRKGYKELARNPVYVAFGRGLNFVWFAFTLFWFWADWKQISRVFTALNAAEWLGVWTTAWLFATAILASWEWLRAALLSIRISEGPLLASRYARVAYATALGLVTFVMTVLLNQPTPDIVYKAF